MKGIYSDSINNYSIEVSNEKVYISKVDSISLHKNDILTECDYEVLDNTFILIRTNKEAYPYPYKDYEVTIDTVFDGNMVTINMPNITVPLIINLDTGSKSGEYILDNTNSLTVKCDYISDILFYILPYNIPEIPFKSNGIENGIVLFQPPVINSEAFYDCNVHVKINIPHLTDKTFTQLYIPGDYIRYENNRLYWRGMTFDKVSEQANDI